MWDDSFRRKNLRVLPLPTRAFLVGQEMGLYFEVYNLVADEFGQDALSRYDSDCGFGTGRGFAKAVGLGRRSIPKCRCRLNRWDTQPSVQVYQFVDLTKAKQGRNRLKIIVEDLNAQRRVSKEMVFRYGK